MEEHAVPFKNEIICIDQPDAACAHDDRIINLKGHSSGINRIYVAALVVCPIISWTSVFAQNNDHCADAVTLEVGTMCTAESFSNAGATPEEDVVALDPTCGSYSGDDVWFKAEVPASGALRVVVDRIASTVPPSFTVYAGTCGNFSEIVCVRNDHGKTIFVPEVADAVIYIRVYGYFGGSPGLFTICIFEPPIPANDACENAIAIPVNSTCTAENYSNVYATAQPGVSLDPSCGLYKGGDIWFTAVMPASGILRIEKDRITGATHPSMAIYTGTCGNFSEVYCSSNDPLETVKLPSLPGETIYLRVFSYNAEEGATFSLCLYEDDPPENDECANAIKLFTGTDCIFSDYSNALATVEAGSIAANPSCGSFAGGDVWFKVDVPLSGRIEIAAESRYGTVPPSIAIYEGTCGNLHEVACLSNQRTKGFFLPELAGETLYLRVYTFGSPDGKPFSICWYEPSCTETVHDGGNIALCQGETFSFGALQITEGGEYAQVFRTATGCDSLVNITVSVVLVDTTVVQQGHQLVASQVGALYQWLDCDTNAPIPGENNPVFTPLVSGDYAVAVTQNNCTRRSQCINVTIVGSKDQEATGLNVYPNPFRDMLIAESRDNHMIKDITLYSAAGTQVKVNTVEHHGSVLLALNVIHLVPGVYVLKVEKTSGTHLLRVVRE